MKKTLLAVAATLALSTAAHAGSFQVGTVTEFVTETDRFTFQLDTTNSGTDNRAPNCNAEKLNFSVSFGQPHIPGAEPMYEIVKEAKLNGLKIAVNGDGNCWAGGEFENATSISLESTP